MARIARLASRGLDGALAEAGGTRAAWLVLQAVHRDPAASQRALAERLGIREATLTHHLTRMASQRLVTRTDPPGDSRSRVVRMTSEGEMLFRTLRYTVQDFDRRMWSGISAEERALLERVLDRVGDNLARSS